MSPTDEIHWGVRGGKESSRTTVGKRENRILERNPLKGKARCGHRGRQIWAELGSQDLAFVLGTTTELAIGTQGKFSLPRTLVFSSVKWVSAVQD